MIKNALKFLWTDFRSFIYTLPIPISVFVGKIFYLGRAIFGLIPKIFTILELGSCLCRNVNILDYKHDLLNLNPFDECRKVSRVFTSYA